MRGKEKMEPDDSDLRLARAGVTSAGVIGGGVGGQGCNGLLLLFLTLTLFFSSCYCF